jgi:thioredoxin 1
MKITDLEKLLQENEKPIMLDLWAPWCGPCRAMEPAFQQIRQKYAGEVEVLKINADESPEILKSLNVMGIPTVMGFNHGKQVVRRTGMQTAEALDILFDATLHERKPGIIPPAPADRLIRTLLGTFLIIFGIFSGQSLLMAGLGAILVFSAFYDRCPIVRALVPRLAHYFNSKK